MGKKYTCCCIIPITCGIYLLFLLQIATALYCLVQWALLLYMAYRSLDRVSSLVNPPWEAVLAVIGYIIVVCPIFMGALFYLRWII